MGLLIGDRCVVLSVAECVALVCDDESALFEELWPVVLAEVCAAVLAELWSVGKRDENTELSSELSGLARMLGKAENRMESAFVVVGEGDSLAGATETEVVIAAPVDEAASDTTAEVISLYTELKILSIPSRMPVELAAGDASLAVMPGTSRTRAIPLCC